MAETTLNEIARRRLTLGEPYVLGFCGHVVRAELEDGTPAVLKVYFPDRESPRWNGNGAVRLLRRAWSEGNYVAPHMEAVEWLL